MPLSVEVMTSSGGKSSAPIIQNVTTTTTRPSPIPDSYLIIIGILVLILLSPMIRSIKAGLLEFTLGDTERTPQPLQISSY